MKTATGNSVLLAYAKAAKELQEDETKTVSEVSAGFIIPSGQKGKQQTRFEVFVKMCRQSNES